MAGMSRHGSASSLQGFSVFQSALGQSLQFLPALGTQELDDMIDALLPGPASIKDKRATVSMDFCEYARQTGETFKYYAVYSASVNSVATDSPASSSAMYDSGYASTFDVSPVVSDVSPWMRPAASFASSSVSSTSSFSASQARGKASRAAPAARKASAQSTDFSSHPGMRIMTRDGRDVTNSASRGSKSKEQRDHAHLMRIIKACDACKRKKIRCDPSHKKRGSSQAQPSSPVESKPAKKARKTDSPPAAPATAAMESGPPPIYAADDFSGLDFIASEAFTNALSSTGGDGWDEFLLYDEDQLSMPFDKELFAGIDYLTPSNSGSSSSASPSQAFAPFTPVTAPGAVSPGSDRPADAMILTDGPTLPYLAEGVHGSNYVDFNLFSPPSDFLDEELRDVQKPRSRDTPLTAHHDAFGGIGDPGSRGKPKLQQQAGIAGVSSELQQQLQQAGLAGISSRLSPPARELSVSGGLLADQSLHQQWATTSAFPPGDPAYCVPGGPRHPAGEERGGDAVATSYTRQTVSRPTSLSPTSLSPRLEALRSRKAEVIDPVMGQSPDATQELYFDRGRVDRTADATFTSSSALTVGLCTTPPVPARSVGLEMTQGGTTAARSQTQTGPQFTLQSSVERQQPPGLVEWHMELGAQPSRTVLASRLSPRASQTASLAAGALNHHATADQDTTSQGVSAARLPVLESQAVSRPVQSILIQDTTLARALIAAAVLSTLPFHQTLDRLLESGTETAPLSVVPYLCFLCGILYCLLAYAAQPLMLLSAVALHKSAPLASQMASHRGSPRPCSPALSKAKSSTERIKQDVEEAAVGHGTIDNVKSKIQGLFRQIDRIRCLLQRPRGSSKSGLLSKSVKLS